MCVCDGVACVVWCVVHDLARFTLIFYQFTCYLLLIVFTNSPLRDARTKTSSRPCLLS